MNTLRIERILAENEKLRAVVDTMRIRHREVKAGLGATACVTCKFVWPCPGQRALDDLDAWLNEQPPDFEGVA